MRSDGYPLLQIAIDVLTTAEAMSIAESTYPFFDVAEIGTPLIIEEGLSALEAVKSKFTDKHWLADVKIMDAGHIEASSAFKRGADIVTVLAAADDVTVKSALEAADEYGGTVMVDMINQPEPLRRAEQLQELGVSFICVHTAYDRKALGADPMAELRGLRSNIACRLGIAGGIGLHNAADAVRAGADIIVVGGAITGADAPGDMAQQIMRSVKEHMDGGDYPNAVDRRG